MKGCGQEAGLIPLAAPSGCGVRGWKQLVGYCDSPGKAMLANTRVVAVEEEAGEQI